jgi:hypothetical protein
MELSSCSRICMDWKRSSAKKYLGFEFAGLARARSEYLREFIAGQARRGAEIFEGFMTFCTMVLAVSFKSIFHGLVLQSRYDRYV